jgi:hypothetical protein
MDVDPDLVLFERMNGHAPFHWHMRNVLHSPERPCFGAGHIWTLRPGLGVVRAPEVDTHLSNDIGTTCCTRLSGPVLMLAILRRVGPRSQPFTGVISKGTVRCTRLSGLVMVLRRVSHNRSLSSASLA